MIDLELPVVIERQPDYTTWGPTSLFGHFLVLCDYRTSDESVTRRAG